MLNFDKSRTKKLKRTRSDLGKLKSDVFEFIEEWNGEQDREVTPERVNKRFHLKRQLWIEAFDILLRPVLTLCKRHGKQSQKWKSESNIRRRQASQSLESDQQLYPLTIYQSMSESCIQSVHHVNCLTEFLPEGRKRVCFSGPTSSVSYKSENRYCSDRPRSILAQKSCIAAKPDYMDYATFKAWRRGSRLSIDVCSMPLKTKECKETKFERIMKNFLSNCVNQMNLKSLPDI